MSCMLNLITDKDIDASGSSAKVFDEDMEFQMVKDFVRKAKSVPDLIRLENNLTEKGKAKPEYLDLIGDKKAKLL